MIARYVPSAPLYELIETKPLAYVLAVAALLSAPTPEAPGAEETPAPRVSTVRARA